MPTYQEQHPTGIGASIRNFFNSFGNRARNNYSNYLPSNIQSSFSSSPLRTGGRVASAVLNPVGTAMNEAARSGWQALGDTRDQNAYNNYMNEMFMNDPGYTGSYGGNTNTPSNPNDPNEHPSQMRPSGHTVAPIGASSASSGGGNRYSHASGNLQSLGGMGRTVGTASMSQISEMLMSGGRGRGERPLFSPHEINEERARAQALGLTLAEARRQGQ